MSTNKRIHTLFTVICTLSMILSAAGRAQGPAQAAPSRPPYASNRLVVKLDGSPLRAGVQERRLEAQSGVDRLRPALRGSLLGGGLTGVYVVELEAGADLESSRRLLEMDPGVEWVEPDYLAYPAGTDFIPNDPRLAEQWSLDQIGAPAAWNLTGGSPEVVIAIVDSGIDLTHPDLTGRLWTNPGEIAGNGIDDDANGYVDDVYGWDFVNDDNDPSDDYGHGTQAAGIAAAGFNNAIGIAGLCGGCRLMAVKSMQASGAANYSDLAAGVLYAAQKGARVISLSSGGYSDSVALRSAIQTAATTYGAVIVAGAGNDNLSTPFYPAAYPEALAVAGTDSSDLKTAISNFGSWVDVSAPAQSLLTTYLGGDYGEVSGTSFAAPLGAGLAGLLRSHNPAWSRSLVQAQMIHTAAEIDGLNPTYAGKLGSGRIAADQALAADPHPLITLGEYAVDGQVNGRPTAGQSASLQVGLVNNWLDASAVSAALSTTDPLVTITQPAGSYGQILAGESRGAASAYTFSIAAAAGYNHAIPLRLTVSAAGGYQTILDFTVTTRSSDQPVGPVTISSNTTWTSDKTYIVNGNIGVAHGATLTIQPGTTVRFNGNYALNIGGTLIADGTAEQPVRFVGTNGPWERILFDDSSTDAHADLDGNYISGNILRHVYMDLATGGIYCNGATPYLDSVWLTDGGVNCSPGGSNIWVRNSRIHYGLRTTTHAAFVLNTVVTGGGMDLASSSRVEDSWVEGTITVPGAAVIQRSQALGVNAPGTAWIEENTVMGDILVGSMATVISNTVTGGGIILGTSGLARGNRIQNCTLGIDAAEDGLVQRNRVLECTVGVRITSGSADGNLIASTDEVGLDVLGSYSVIANNTFTLNRGSAIRLAGSSVVAISDNNLEGNLGPYDIENLIPAVSQNPISAQFNWWGTNDPSAIAGRIYDGNDGNYNLGLVSFLPLTTEPLESAPAYVRSVTSDPAGTIGIETATFDVTYSRPLEELPVPQMEVQFQNTGWTTTNSMPEIKPGITAAVVGELIYVIGADDTRGQLHIYNPKTDSWTRGADLPDPRDSPGIAAAGGKIYVIGGTYSAYDATSRVDEYDPSSNTWRRVADMLTPRSLLGAVTLDGKVYAIGGRIYGGPLQLKTVEVYDPAANAWQSKSDLPLQRESPVVAASEGRIYVFGGFFEGSYLADVLVYEPHFDVWQRLADMPKMLIDHTAVTAETGEIYIPGGRGLMDTEPQPEVYIYNPRVGSWRTGHDLPAGRSGSGAAALGGKIYVIGGRQPFGGFANTVYSLPVFLSRDFHSQKWSAPTVFQAALDFNALFPRGNYDWTVSGGRGPDGIEPAPYSTTFEVDYAGAIGDTSPPGAPIVRACAKADSGQLTASWLASDPDGAITRYRYAIGLTPGASDVIGWTSTTGIGFNRSGLGLTAGQMVYITVSARNTGGIWSTATTTPGIAAGSNVCASSGSQIYLPAIYRR